MIYYVHTKDSPYPYQSKGLLHVRDEKTEAEKEKATKNSLRSHVEPCTLWGSWLCTLSSKPHHSPRTMHTKTVPLCLQWLLFPNCTEYFSSSAHFHKGPLTFKLWTSGSQTILSGSPKPHLALPNPSGALSILLSPHITSSPI